MTAAKTNAHVKQRTNSNEPADAAEMTQMRPAFRLDFLRLLKYHELERCRLVNSSYDKTIARAGHLVRPTFKRFWIRHIIWFRRSKRSGFIDGRHVFDHSKRRLDWMTLSKGMRCCNKWKAEAARLTGQRIVLNGPDNRHVWMEVTNERGDRIAIGVLNTLNRETAFHFLHFLKHLDGALFEQADISFAQHDNAAMQLNPAVFQFLSENHPQRVKMLYRLSDEDVQALTPQVRQAIQLVFHLGTEQRQ